MLFGVIPPDVVLKIADTAKYDPPLCDAAAVAYRLSRICTWKKYVVAAAGTVTVDGPNRPAEAPIVVLERNAMFADVVPWYKSTANEAPLELVPATAPWPAKL